MPAETVTPGTEQAGETAVPSSALATGVDDTPAGGETPTPDPGAEAAVGLLGQAQYDAVKNDPAKLAAALHKSYTQKTQALASRADFLQAFDEDPEGTLTRLAAGYGLKVDKAPTVAATASAKLAEVLGEEGAAAIAPIIDAMVDEKLATVKQGQEALEMEAANHAADALLEKFTAKYPDWKQYEQAMMAIGEEIVPNIKPGKAFDEFQYMERLLALAKGSAAVGDGVQAHSARVAAAARGAAHPAAGVSATRVAPLPGGKITFDEAWANGKKNVAYDPEDIMAAKREEWRKQKAARKSH